MTGLQHEDTPQTAQEGGNGTHKCALTGFGVVHVLEVRLAQSQKEVFDFLLAPQSQVLLADGEGGEHLVAPQHVVMLLHI
jgi:hypothetical protein